MSTAEHVPGSPAPPAAPLIDMTTVPPEHRDRVWYEQYYQGEHVPQLTTRAVMMGGLIGMVMAISNLYTTIKLGWSFGVAITASVLSYTVWNALYSARIAKTKMTVLENNCMQSTASSAGYSTGGTLGTAVGALLLINGDAARMSWIPLTIWVGLVAILGVFLAIPMKRQMINQEQLAFPSGIAAAETLKSLYAEGLEAKQKGRALVLAMGAGGIVGMLRNFAIIPETIPFPGRLTSVRGKDIGMEESGLYFEPSLLMIAAGMIVGLRVSVSMLLGAIINWFVLVPLIAARPDFAATGFVGDFDASFGADGAVTALKVTKWSLWLGTSIMVTSGLTSFALGWRTILRAFTGFFARGPKSEMDEKIAAIEVPTLWLALGLVPTTIGLTALCYLSFGIAPWLGVLSVVLSFVLALVACRATGETDTTPVGAMGKITQLIYAGLAPANLGVNLITAGITAGAASSSADLLTDLKSGYLLGANPRKQFIAQFVGVFFGMLAVVPAWYILVPNKAALEAYNPPATNMWAAVATALSRGIDSIPPTAQLGIVVGGIIGIALPLVGALVPKSVERWMPSAMGLGLAFVVPFSNSLTFFLGAVIASIWTSRDKESAEKYIVPLASGAVAGESLAAAAFAMWNARDAMWLAVDSLKARLGR